MAPNYGFRKTAANGGEASKRRKRDKAPLATLDPSTGCDRQYTAEETELLAAMADYQKSTGRRFPTYCEVLAVAKRLGYRKLPIGPC